MNEAPSRKPPLAAPGNCGAAPLPAALPSSLALALEDEGTRPSRALVIAGLSLLLHVGIFLLPLPAIEGSPEVLTERHSPIILKRAVIPPPPPAKERKIRPVERKMIPVPDPDPDAPEPIIEPAPEYPDPVFDEEIEIEGYATEPPPEPSVLTLVSGITHPVLIESTRVEPGYPSMPRKARLPGNVLLQAVVQRDGTVGEIVVMSASPAKLGFEEAAVAAVREWRYEPATQRGRPVAVYISVKVTFSML